MTKRKFLFVLPFIAYVLISVGLATRSVCLRLNDVEFDLASTFTCNEFLSHYWIFGLQISALFIGFLLAVTFPKILPSINIKLPRFKVRRGLWPIISILLQAAILLPIVFTLLDSLDIFDPANRHLTRVMRSSKSVDSFLLVAALMSLGNLQARKFAFAAVSMNIFVAIIFAWVDGSRASLLAPLIYVLYMYISGKWIKSSIFIFILLFVLTITMRARGMNDKSLLNFIDISFAYISSLWSGGFSLSSLSYFFHFSVLHLVEVYQVSLGRFNWTDLLYSITPIPSRFHWLEVNPNAWRISAFRPMGAMGELITLSEVMFFTYNFLFGYLAGRLFASNRGLIFLAGFAVLFFAFMLSFQYGLRTAQWMIYLSIAIGMIGKVNRLKSDRYI